MNRISIFKSRYSVLIAFILFFLLVSQLVRLGLLIVSFSKTDLTLTSLFSIISKGLIFDFGVAIFFSLIYALYLLVIPRKKAATWFNYATSYTILFLMVLISMFSFFAELTFWQEFETRFNFIAVDYLVYTFEVINNINESYPLPILISSMLLITLLVIYLFRRFKFFEHSFTANTPFKQRLAITASVIGIAFFYGLFVKNSWAEKSENHYQNELSKAGVYSFFSAFKNNELNYDLFYAMLDKKQAFKIVRNNLKEAGAKFTGGEESIRRQILNEGTELKPNVVMITIESFSADFMAHFGNKQNLTPELDSIANHSLLFTDMYATGTRTVRGMEALSLAVPPTPGNSIVRRPNNDHLTTIGEIFRSKGYATSFYYGGDGYFDNMNQYFSSNGFDIIDRGRKISVGDNYETKRTIIPDNQVHFENAWGICDEDIYNAMIRDADVKYAHGKSFYNFVMTTSNHRPFTYPNGEIDIPSGSGRDGAVKYTDYAIRQLMEKCSKKPWFKNTVFIFVADHCASSAGKNEIDISKYHIPCMIYNLKNDEHASIDKMCSQIDLYPTLFHVLGWDYQSNLYGKDVLSKNYSPRVVLGTYQKLAYIKQDSLVILSPQKTVETYLYQKSTNEQQVTKLPTHIINEAISYYQTAYYLYKHNGLKK